MFAEWKPSDELKKQYFIDNGKQLSSTEKIEFDPQLLTPEQRETLLKCRTTGQVIWQLPSMTVGVIRPYKTAAPEFKLKAADVFEQVPTMDEWLARAEQAAQSQAVFVDEMEAAMSVYREDLLAEFEKMLADKMQRIRNLINQHAYWALNYSEDIAQYEIDRLTEAGVTTDLSEYHALRDEYNAKLPAFKEEKIRRDAAEEIAKAAKREEERLEQLAWAREHGSERLVKCLEQKYPCSRLYKLERAAVEFAGFTLDLQRKAEISDKICPSLDALTLRENVLAAHPELDVTIVWLTKAPQEDSQMQDDYDEEDEFEPCEAIMVDSPEFSDYLYRIV